MTTEREKIIALAQLSGICLYGDFLTAIVSRDDIEAFYRAAQAEAFESDAKLCDENACDYTREGAEVCATAIREMAKDKQNAD